MATRCSRMLSSVSSGSQLPLSLNAFSPARTSRQTMLRFAPDILVTAASNTLEAARQMSGPVPSPDRKSTRLNSSHSQISYAVFCLKKKKKHINVLLLRKHHEGG